jgi:hypothetical protein
VLKALMEGWSICVEAETEVSKASESMPRALET